MRHHSSLNIKAGDRIRLGGLAGVFTVDRVWGRMLDATTDDGRTELTSTWAIVMILPRGAKGCQNRGKIFDRGNRRQFPGTIGRDREISKISRSPSSMAQSQGR